MKPLNINEILTATGGTLLQGDASLVVVSVETDSRKIRKGSLFVPFIGERIDAHTFIPQVFEAGAVATFTQRKDLDFVEGKVYIYVENMLDGLQKMATYYRNQFQVPIVGVTGSVGKTTTKEMIAAVLEKKYRVLKTFGNLNSQIGLSLMMFQIDDSVDIAVIEMGISEFHEMERLVAIARPEVAVMTNVGVSHIGNLGTRENICIEKGKIVSYLPEDGEIYICGNGDLIELSQKNICRIDGTSNFSMKYYGTESGCEYQAKNIRSKEGQTTFTFFHHGTEEFITLSVLGQHNVNNGLVALLIGEKYGVKWEEAKQALYDYRPIAMRGEIRKGNQRTIIDDTYNASPDSIQSGLDVLFDLENPGRKIAVLADVLELGKQSKELHQGIGQFIVQQGIKGRNIHELVTVGEEAAYISDVVEENSKKIKVHHFSTKQEAIAYLDHTKESGDLLLIKGSRGMQMDQVVTALLKE